MSTIRSVGPDDAPPGCEHAKNHAVGLAQRPPVRMGATRGRETSVARDVSAGERGSVNADRAARVAAAVGIPEPSSDGRSERFAYFADGDRFLVVAGEQARDAVQLALAYGMAWAGERRLVLALPHEHATATRQRLPWFSDRRRPDLWLHSGERVERAPAIERAAAIRALTDRLDGRSPQQEFTAASTALHLGSGGGAVDVLVQWATRDVRLDAAHRQSERSWHCTGQRVLSIRRTRTGLRILGGVHGSSDDRAPVTVELPAEQALTEPQLGALQQAIEQAIARRLDPDGDLHRPDEHWLQAVLRAPSRPRRHRAAGPAGGARVAAAGHDARLAPGLCRPARARRPR